MDSVQEETRVVSTTGLILVNGTQSSSSTLKAPTQTDGSKPNKYGNLIGESSSGLKGRKPCKHLF